MTDIPLGEKQQQPGSSVTTTSTTTAVDENVPVDDGLDGPSLPKLRFWLLCLGVGCGLFLSMLDSSIVATSMFRIAIEFHDIERINWVALSYTLAYLGCAVLFARISDVIGRRWAFLAAYILFIGFSLGCGASQSLAQLIVNRALQGVGGSGLYSLTMIILPELTPDAQKRFIAAVIGVVVAIAGVLGPVLGGILTEYAGWRWIFYINGPVGAISLLLFLFAWPDKKYLPHLEKKTWKDVDFVGSVLLIAAAVLIVFPFQNNSTEVDSWSQAVFLAPLLCGIFALIGLAGWVYCVEKKWHGKATIPLELLRNHVFTATILNTACLGFPYLLSVYSFPIWFQVVNKKSALDAGLMLLPMLGATAVGSTVGGAINGKANRLFETMVVACLLMIVGCALETTAPASVEVQGKVLGFLVLIGLGFGLSASASTMLANLESPIHEHASAQGIVAQIRIWGGSIGIAASSAILSVKSEAHFRADAEGLVNPEMLVLQQDSLTEEQWQAIRRMYTAALKQDMIVCCGVTALALIFTLGIYRRNRVSIQDQQRNKVMEERQRVLAAKAQDRTTKAGLESVATKAQV